MYVNAWYQRNDWYMLLHLHAKVCLALPQGLWIWPSRWISYVCRTTKDSDKFISNTQEIRQKKPERRSVFRLMMVTVLGLLSSCVLEGQSLVHRTKVWQRWDGSERNPSWTVLYYIYSFASHLFPSSHLFSSRVAQAVAVVKDSTFWILSHLRNSSGCLAWVLTPALCSGAKITQ